MALAWNILNADVLGWPGRTHLGLRSQKVCTKEGRHQQGKTRGPSQWTVQPQWKNKAHRRILLKTAGRWLPSLRPKVRLVPPDGNTAVDHDGPGCGNRPAHRD